MQWRTQMHRRGHPPARLVALPQNTFKICREQGFLRVDRHSHGPWQHHCCFKSEHVLRRDAAHDRTGRDFSPTQCCGQTCGAMAELAPCFGVRGRLASTAGRKHNRGLLIFIDQRRGTW